MWCVRTIQTIDHVKSCSQTYCYGRSDVSRIKFQRIEGNWPRLSVTSQPRPCLVPSDDTLLVEYRGTGGSRLLCYKLGRTTSRNLFPRLGSIVGTRKFRGCTNTGSIESLSGHERSRRWWPSVLGRPRTKHGFCHLPKGSDSRKMYLTYKKSERTGRSEDLPESRRQRPGFSWDLHHKNLGKGSERRKGDSFWSCSKRRKR